MSATGAAGAPGEGRGMAMGFDSYRSPDAVLLVRAARERFTAGDRATRLALTEGVGAIAFVTAALTLLLATSSERGVTAWSLAVSIGAYLVAQRVEFPVGSAVSVPTQVVFVPMLFLLPAAIVPLIVAGCLVLDLGWELRDHRVTGTRILTRLGDSAYALGPPLVLVLMHAQRFSWSHWPALVLGFAAYVVLDLSSGLARTWFAERIAPSRQWQMLWVYPTDAGLFCVGLFVAASAATRPGLLLLSLPLLAMFGLFARERRQRVDGMLELSSAYRGTAMLLGDLLEVEDEYTGVHSRQVVDLALAVAERLGLGSETRLNVEFGALLHDIGKIRIPPEIIGKRGALDEREWELMRQHTIVGEEMLQQVGGTLSRVGRIVRASHEHFDGCGYPDGLTGELIPIEARIIAACDAYNAMTTDRAYRGRRPGDQALAELRRCAGSQFDPAVVEAIEGQLGGACGLAQGGVPAPRLVAVA